MMPDVVGGKSDLCNFMQAQQVVLLSTLLWGMSGKVGCGKQSSGARWTFHVK